MIIMHPDQMSDEWKKKKVPPMTKEEWMKVMEKKGFHFTEQECDAP